MKSAKRLLPCAALLAAFATAWAQSTARTTPPGTAAVDDAPPSLPRMTPEEAAKLQPQVTTRKEGDATIQEYRRRGRVFMVRVVPSVGPAYWLVDHKGDGQLSRMDSLDPGLRVPQWVLLEF